MRPTARRSRQSSTRIPGLLWNTNVVLCLSLSKLGLPATRTGIVVADEAVIEALTAFNATAALAPGCQRGRHRRAVAAHGRTARSCATTSSARITRSGATPAIEWLRTACDGLPLRIHQPEGAFFLWLWFPGLPITSAELYRRLKAPRRARAVGPPFFPGPGAVRRRIRRNACASVMRSRAENVRAGISIIAEEVRRASAHSVERTPPRDTRLCRRGPRSARNGASDLRPCATPSASLAPPSRRALRDDPAAARAAFGTEVDEPVGFGDHVEVVLDDDDRVAGIDQPMQHANQFLDVGHVQTDGRFVEHVQRVLRAGGGAARRFASSLRGSRTCTGRSRASSVTSLMRWASPPDSVGLGCPSVR